MSNEQSIKTHYRNCSLCDSICGLEIKTQGKNVVSIRGDKKDTFSRGHICPKGVALQDIYKDPDRLRHPVRRTETGWERISWDDAFNEISTQIKKVKKQHGNDAVGVYIGNPVSHDYASLLYVAPLLNTLNTRNRYSSMSIDSLPFQLASQEMFGHPLIFPVPDVLRTDYLLIVGANPIVSNGSIMGIPDVTKRFKELRQRNGKIVVIDPRFTETAAVADEHHFIQPGSDALLLLALLHTLFEEGLANPGRLQLFTDGIETLEQLVKEYSPETVTNIVGIDADTIRRLAREFVNAKSASCYGRIGISTQAFGTITNWLLLAFNIVAGKMDLPGGLMFTNPVIDLVELAVLAGERGHFGEWKTRVRQLPEFLGEAPVITLADEILSQGSGQIKALITIAGNPVLSAPNGNKLDRALDTVDFMVSIDHYINETTCHANIVLPPTVALEHGQFGLLFHSLMIHNTVKYGAPVFDPEPGAMHEWEIFLELQTRLASNSALSRYTATVVKKVMQKVGPEGLLSLVIQLGPYGLRSLFKRNHMRKNRLSLKKIKKEKHGIDLGPLKSHNLPQQIVHKNKRIQLAPPLLVNDLRRLKKMLSNAESKNIANVDNENITDRFNLSLISRRHIRSNNSWMHNYPRLVKGKPRCTVMVNPLDIRTIAFNSEHNQNINNKKMQINNGDVVRVKSKNGFVELPIHITQDIKPGVICIPYGWGHDNSRSMLNVARRVPGINVNSLTDDQFFDELSGTAAYSGVPVCIERISENTALNENQLNSEQIETNDYPKAINEIA